MLEQVEEGWFLSLVPIMVSRGCSRLGCQVDAQALATSKADDLYHDQKGEHEPNILAIAVTAGHVCLWTLNESDGR